MYEYSINYGQAPLTLLVSYTKSSLSMVGLCCTSPNPTVCFLKEVSVILLHSYVLFSSASINAVPFK